MDRYGTVRRGGAWQARLGTAGEAGFGEDWLGEAWYGWRGEARFGEAGTGLARHGRRGSAEKKKEEYTWCTSTKCPTQR